MITKELIDRINYLSRKSRAEGLTEEEKAEQQQVRQQYLTGIRANVKATLDNVEWVDETSDTGNKGKGHQCGCSGCGCGGKHHKH